MLRKVASIVVLAVGLGAQTTVQAAFVYSLTTTDDGIPNFVLTTPALISVDTTFLLADFDSIVIDPTPVVTSVEFRNPLTNPTVEFLHSSGSYGFFWTNLNPFTGPGVYCSGTGSCAESAAIMTIREVSGVPEPGTLALIALGFGIAGLAAMRCRAH